MGKKKHSHSKRVDPIIQDEDVANLPNEGEEQLKGSSMELTHILHDSDHLTHRLPTTFMKGMRVEARFYLNSALLESVEHELEKFKASEGTGFTPAVMQLANVACLPGIVGASIGLPDIHSGYGFAIGNVAAFDTSNPESIVSPGGVGYDINCGVRLIRTNLSIHDIRPVQETLAKLLFDYVPSGVGSTGPVKLNQKNISDVLERGLEWAIDNGYAWKEDADFCEEGGKMKEAKSQFVSARAKSRGISQIGTLGAGNHYAEVQAVEEIYDEKAARAMGIREVGQICIMVHCGSRGLGHQVASDYVALMQTVMRRDHIEVKDRQLACARIQSKEGTEYLGAMAAAANFAYANRSVLTHFIRKAFSELFVKTPEELDMGLVYDVSHNMAKLEEHMVDGEKKSLLVHRKGSTRAFPPHHPLIPSAYQEIGQPVLVGGSMGTCSYVLTGTPKGMSETFGSTCHGAGRLLSRVQSKKTLNHEELLQELKNLGITLCVGSPGSICEEAPSSYKNVCDVVETCELAGLSKKAFKLIPLCVVKG